MDGGRETVFTSTGRPGHGNSVIGREERLGSPHADLARREDFPMPDHLHTGAPSYFRVALVVLLAVRASAEKPL